MSSIDASLHTPEYPPEDVAPSKRRTLVTRVVMWTLIALISIGSLYAGTKLRQWFIDFVAPVHFHSDNARNYAWGYYTYYHIRDRGGSFLDVYDYVGIQQREGHYIDYAPARLWVYTMWIGSHHDWPVEEQIGPPKRPSQAELGRPGPYSPMPATAPPRVQSTKEEPTKGADEIRKWQRTQRDFWAWFIDFNTIFEAIGAVGAFMLVRHVVLGSGASAIKANTLALAGALLLWFNIAMIVSGHGWPSGDLWVVPPFIWTVYFCRRGNWAVAGAVFAIGALFKGQTFFVMPMFVLWPIFQLRWRAALAFLGGFFGLFGLATCGWTLTQVDEQFVRHKDWPAITFAVLLGVITVLLAILRPIVLRRLPTERKWVLPTAITSFALLPILTAMWPCFAWELPTAPFGGPSSMSWVMLAYAVLAAMAVTAALAVTFARKWQTLATLAFALFGMGALASMLLFSTNVAWFDASYLFGTDHWTFMVMGLTSNLPGIMAKRFNWDMTNGPEYVVWTLFANSPRAIDITLKTLLFSIYLLLTVLCTIGVAWHDRRNSTRFLVAVVTPWLLFYTIPCQIHERYLLFAAAAASICIGHSIGAALLGVFLTVLAAMMPFHVMINNGFSRRNWNVMLRELYPDWFAQDTKFAQQLHVFFQGTHPDIGWAVILSALIFVWIALTPSWRRMTSSEKLPLAPVQAEPHPLEYAHPQTETAAMLPETDRPATAS